MIELWLCAHTCLLRSISLIYPCPFLIILEVLIIYLKILLPDIVLAFYYFLFCQDIHIISLQLLKFDKLLHTIFNKYYLEDYFLTNRAFGLPVLLVHEVCNVPIIISLIKELESEHINIGNTFCVLEKKIENQC